MGNASSSGSDPATTESALYLPALERKHRPTTTLELKAHSYWVVCEVSGVLFRGPGPMYAASGRFTLVHPPG